VTWNRTGPAGTNGTNGTNGTGATVAPGAPASDCPDGGVTVTDGSGDTVYACSGATGPQGPQGPPGTSSLFGSNGLDFFEGSSAGADCTLGQITLNVAAEYPDNYLPADGQILPISQYTALLSLIGVNYGGNGTSNFALPNLTPAAPNDTLYLICVSGVFP
jgi:Phage Tail Collar Domain